MEYTGNTAIVACWTQELLGYHFSMIHRPARMMTDVDGLTRRVDTLSSQYAHIALLLSNVDHQKRTPAYTNSIIGCDQAANIVIDDSNSANLVPILTNSAITRYIGSLKCDFISKR